MKSIAARRLSVAAIVSTVVTLGALLVALPQSALAGPTTVTRTYSYTGSTDAFTVPSGITHLTVTIIGAEGGNGGADATPAPPPGGYRGVVTGTLAVTPGQVLTVAVGSHGGTGASSVNAGTPAARGGSNPLGGYAGGNGGLAGSRGSSGQGGAGGGASVLRIGSADAVAAGGGGSGGSGQYSSTRGHTATATYQGRTDVTSTTGQRGQNAADACAASSCNNDDGGGSGGGGGGAQGGATGDIQFGAGSSNEWYGFGGSVGQNSTASFAGLTSSYEYYSDNVTDGSIVISYTTGAPGAPTGVTGTTGDASVSLVWTAPTDFGQSDITDYLVTYSSDGGTTWSTAVDMGSTATSGTVTGLTNGTGYVFQVAAVSATGTGAYSSSSPTITPQGPPSAPAISAVTAQDGALSLSITAPDSGAAVTGYDYRVDGGAWVGIASPSTTLVIPGLLNGTAYTVEVRAESAVGASPVSSPSSGTPQAVPGAPTISSLAVGIGALSVAFTPGFNGGGAISSYQYRLNGGAWVTASGLSSPIGIGGLSAGTAYAVELRAVNVAGPGAASAPASATTPTTPGAPDVNSVTAGDGAVVVTFTAGSTGGSAIDHYQYQIAGGAWTDASGASPMTITGLANGTPVDVSIRAVNALGAGTASSPRTVTPATVPGAPAIVGDTVAGSDARLSAAFTAPTSDGGSTITGYQYSTDGGATWRTRDDGGSTSSPVVITTLSRDGSTVLVNGTTYYVELRAVNARGSGTASAVAVGIARTTPSAPVISHVTSEPSALHVAFTAPANGGAAITAYQFSTDAGARWTSTGGLGTDFGITGLTNGTHYTVIVRAVNSVGNGAPSAGVGGTPATLPGAPDIDSVVRSNQTLTTAVHLDADGGSPLTGWQYSTDGGSTWADASGTSSPLTLTALSADTATRLANGTGYALQVRAVTAVGAGPASATTIVAPASVPAAPSVALTAGESSISVAFSLSTDGGSPLTALDYSLDNGAHWVDPGTLSSPFTIAPLTNGTSYSLIMRADNAIGHGASSAPASATPRTIPGAPTSVTAVSDSASADVGWSAPSDDGGGPITGYTASAYTSSASATAVSSCTTTGATDCSIPSLVNGTAYYIAVAATNDAGTGPASAPRVLVTPLARPAAPTLSGLTVGDASISVSFSAGSAGDRPITGYQYSTDGGTTWSAAGGTTSPILVTGLTNGTAYVIALRAVSSAGAGAASNHLTGTPYTYPSEPSPSTIVANAGDRSIAVSWDAPNLNGGTLLNYTATAFSGLSSGTTMGTCVTTTLSCTISGLSNGTTYYISLQTENTAAMYSKRSDPRIPATPSLTPGAPTSVSGVAGDGRAGVSWTAPMSTGASSLGGYTVWCSANGAPYVSCGATSGTSTTITGLSNGTSYTFKVTASNLSGTGPLSSASSALVPLAPGTVPTLAAPTPTATGFTTLISNYDPATSYTASVTNGATVVISGSAITVTGLTNGAGSHLVVGASKADETATTAALDGVALLTGTAPTFRDVAATADGFTFTIANFDGGLSYTAAVLPGSGVVVLNADGSGVVSGETAGTLVSVTVTVVDPGVSLATASTSATVLLPTSAVRLSAAVPLAGGYRFTIDNYDAGLSYSFVQSAGGTAVRSGDTVTISGLGAAVFSETTVSATSTGHTTVSSTVGGTSFPNGRAPSISAVDRTDDGFTFTIDRRSGVSYRVTSDAGTVTLSGSTVTVTGLGVGATTTVHITASESGSLDSTMDVAGTAIAAGVAPVLAAPVSAARGYVVTITNYSAAVTYRLSTSSGSVTQSGARLTVIGLDSGATAILSVTATRGGYHDASAITTGRALEAASGTTSPPDVLRSIVESTAGGGAVMQNGAPVLAHLSHGSSRATVSTGDGLRLTVEARDGTRVLPLAPDGVVEVRRGGQVQLTVSGLEGLTQVEIWGMSLTTRLGATQTDAAGSAGQLLRLPHAFGPGVHTLVVTGHAADGSAVTLQLGIRVLDATRTAAVSPGADWLWVLLLALAIALVASAWFVVARRRRRREQDGGLPQA